MSNIFVTAPDLLFAIDNYLHDNSNGYPPIGTWNVSSITDMSSLFKDIITTDEKNQKLEGIGNWDVSNVKFMQGMFDGCSRFDQSINSWNVSKVTHMDGMFKKCSMFNHPLNLWNVGTLLDTAYMFEGCIIFNQNINDWDVSNVKSMENMFKNCSSLNQPFNNWDVRNVKSMESMFEGCTNFNQPLNSWDITNVKYMNSMFKNCINFNQDLSDWNVSNSDIDDIFTMSAITPDNYPLGFYRKYKIDSDLKQLNSDEYTERYYYPELDNDFGEDEFYIDDSFEMPEVPKDPLYFTQEFYSIFIEFVKNYLTTTKNDISVLVKLKKYINRVLWNPHGLKHNTKKSSSSSLYIKKIEVNDILPKLKVNPLSNLSPIVKSTLIHYIQLFITYFIPEWNSEHIVTGAQLNYYLKARTIMLHVNVHGQYLGSKPQIKELEGSVLLMKKFTIPFTTTMVTPRSPDIHTNMYKYYSELDSDPDKVVTMDKMKEYLDKDILRYSNKFGHPPFIYEKKTKKNIIFQSIPRDEEEIENVNTILNKQRKLTEKYKTKLNKYTKKVSTIPEPTRSMKQTLKKITKQINRTTKRAFKTKQKYLDLKKQTDVIDMTVNIDYINRYVTRISDYLLKLYTSELQEDMWYGFSGIYNLKTGNNLMKNSALINYVKKIMELNEETFSDYVLYNPDKNIYLLESITNEALFNFLSEKGYLVIQLLDEACEVLEEPSSNLQELVRRSHAAVSVGFGKKNHRRSRKKPKN